MTPREVPQVLIVGAGIGGLCLAHGLRAADIPCRVVERTHTPTDWVQGYRIHIDPHGSTALHRCLSPAAWQAFLGAVSDEASGFAFRTEQLAPLLEIADAGGGPEPSRRHHGISRVALRETLLTGLDGIVEFGRGFERYELGTDGRVTAHFSDDTSATADLIVGADGANSRVRTQLLPHAGRADTGVVAIAGKHRLDREHPTLAPALTRGAVSVLPSRRGFLFSAVWLGDRTRVAPPVDAPTGFLFDTTTDYVFWAYADAAAAFPPLKTLSELSGSRLQEIVGDKIAGWSPHLRALVSGSEPETVNALRVRSADPVRPWTTGPVTLLGDAIHNMTPMAGIGANTALRDADLLRRVLINTPADPAALRRAISGYEHEMLGYGFAAVADSLRNARLAGSESRLQRATIRTLFRVIDHIPAAKRRMFAPPT